jgi:hypothetical protein
MKTSVLRWLYVSALLGLAVIMAPAATAADLLPEGLEIVDGFEPGPGPAVGEITRVAGDVILIHKNSRTGYRAVEGAGLFEDDTIVTLADSHAALKMADASFITLSPETRLILAKSVYAPEKNIRSTFVEMILGKTRFVVQSLVKSRRSEFKVKTLTSVAGVRGSDFIIYATASATEITALADTRIEVLSLAALDAAPLILRDFEQTRVLPGMPPEAARKLDADEIDRLMREFRFQPAPVAPEDLAAGPAVEAGSEPVVESPGSIVVDKNDLLHPGADRVTPDVARGAPLADHFRVRTTLAGEEEAVGTRDRIFHHRVEDEVKSRLPDFPGAP